MRYFFFLFLIYLQKIILKEEEKIKKDQNKNETESLNFNEEEGYFPGDKIYELNDLIFDHVIRDGKIYRWFILFYSKACGHCRNAKKEIKKIFENYKNNKTLRFAEIEAYDNSLTNVRFNITGVPYMILVENNSIYEMDLFPNYDNLERFIKTNFTEVEEEIKPLPKKVKFYYVAWVIFKQTLESITNSFNNLLKRKGINIKFNPYIFILTVLLVIILCCFGCVKCCIYCCCNDDDIANELKKLEEQYNLELEKRKKEGDGKESPENEEGEGEEGENEEGEEEEDDEGEEEEEDDEGEEVEDENKKEISEEEKKRIEKQKEEELKKIEEEKRKKEEEEKKKIEENIKKEERQNKKKKKKKKE